MSAQKLTVAENHARISQAGAKDALLKFEGSRKAIRDAIAEIRADVKKNGGAYLGGRQITKAEVLRVAGKSPSYLNKKEPPHLVALAGEVDAFVEEMRTGAESGVHPVHRAVMNRANAVEEELALVRQAYAETELELNEAHAVLRDAEKTIAELQATNTSLLKQLSDKTVVDLPTRRK